MLGFIPKVERARKILQFNLYPDGARALLGLTADRGLVRWLRVLLGPPLSFATLHNYQI